MLGPGLHEVTLTYGKRDPIHVTCVRCIPLRASRNSLAKKTAAGSRNCGQHETSRREPVQGAAKG
eukprot:4733942-Prymnesium_polylepis.1